MMNFWKSADRTTNNLMLDPLGIKPERDKMTPSSHERGREEERPHSKDSASVQSRLTPHSAFPPVSSASALHDERGFQPYRPGDDPLRHSLPLTSLDAYTAYLAQAQAAAAAYPTSPYAGHPSVRMDDPLLLERYRLMQSSALAGYPYTHPGLMAHPGLSPYLAQSRYPAEMLAQMGYPYLHPGAKLPDLSPGAAERLKSDEERRLEREREEAREREKERERQREKEEKERLERERLEKERAAQKENERRLNSGVFSADRLLGTSSGNSLYAHSSMHEPLDLKRYDERSRHLHVNGERSAEERSQLPPAAHSYRPVDSSRSSAHPQLGVPPLSVPKPSHPSHEQSHTFHRPFEAPVTNGYDRQSMTEYERLVKEREKMLTEHRLANEKAQAQKLAESREARSRTGERAHSGDSRSSERVHDIKTDPQRSRVSVHDNKTTHYGSTAHSSHARRSLLPTSKPYGYPVDKHTHSKQQDMHKSVKSQDNQPLVTSQSALSSLQNFSHSSPAITSLSNMINSEHMLPRYDQTDKHKDSTRLNGAHASSRMRLQPEVEKRKRMNSGESHSVSLVSKQKPSPKKHSRPVILFPTKQEKHERRDLSYEPPAKRLHLSGDVEHASRDSRPFTADDLNREPDYRKKAEFLFMFKLEAVPPERRRENEFMQRVCAWDKDRREKARLNPPPPCSVDSISLPYEYSTARMSQFIAAYSSPLKRKHCASTPLQQSNQSAALPRSHDPVNSQSKSVIQSTAIGQSPAVTAEFVQEFHESVLQQTRQQRLNKDNISKSQQRSAEVRYSLSTDSSETNKTSNQTSTHTYTTTQSDSQSLPSSLQSIQNMTSQLLGGTQKSMTSWQHKVVTSQSSDAGDSEAGEYRWPGVEAVMLAYHKHLQEVRTEKQILVEQCDTLQQQHRQLTHTAQQLSRRMEELLQNKQRYEEDRSKHQSKLDSLRRGLLSLR